MSVLNKKSVFEQHISVTIRVIFPSDDFLLKISKDSVMIYHDITLNEIKTLKIIFIRLYLFKHVFGHLSYGMSAVPFYVDISQLFFSTLDCWLAVRFPCIWITSCFLYRAYVLIPRYIQVILSVTRILSLWVVSNMLFRLLRHMFCYCGINMTLGSTWHDCCYQRFSFRFYSHVEYCFFLVTSRRLLDTCSSYLYF